MSDSLVSPVVGLTMYAASAAAIAYSVKKSEICEKKIPMMGVMGAFVFAAQMVNFTIPATGSSGHITGGILLAAIIGGGPALISVAAILTIQCLFFADGGLLALGCNIFNLGVVPCLIVYPLIFKPLLKEQASKNSITLAAIVSAVVALQLGAFGVVLQTLASGISELPFATFALFMQPIHLVIGAIEGIVTAAILCYVHKMRPEILETGSPTRKILVGFAVAALLTGCVLSLFTSQNPDGLEWAIEKTLCE